MLSLAGDFTGGGNYVQASIALPKDRMGAIFFWVNAPPGSTRLPIRIIDAGEDRVEITVDAPGTTAAREARILVQLLAGSATVGELTVPVRVTE